jgi:hypothetical protein|tara:strand:+ start:310 stop:591 length:282 start_codon:yes stop_codon:yes gene_type:complete
MEEDCKFYVQGAGWDMLVSESSATSAATTAFERAYEEYGKKVKVSPHILVIDLCKVTNGDCETSLKLLDTASVLADAGLHQLSRQFKRVISRE